MGVEASVEQGLKTAFQTFTETLGYDVAYRCYWLDDETLLDEEVKEYPFVQITASPNVPTHHKATFRDVPVEIKIATHAKDDKKRAQLKAIYEGIRAVVDAESTISFSGYNLIGAIIDSGGTSEVDEHEQYVTLPLTIKICGA